MIDFSATFSRRVLLRLAAFVALGAVVVTGSIGFIGDLYFRQQLTHVGLAINGSIVVLFVLGLAKVVGTLIRYAREEAALARFVRRVEEDDRRLAEGIDPKSLIVQRYRMILVLSKQNAPINHSALASTLAASESTKISFPKFINNILILTGVFGTIVSLAIALVGASNLLDSVGETGNMGLVVHGMSTALSTTITAIVCYVFYGYFYLKVSDAQTHLLSGIEQVTALYLLPRFSHSSDTMLHEVAGLVRSVRKAAESLQMAQVDYAEAGKRLIEVVSSLTPRMHALSEEVSTIKHVMREGFRLPDTGDQQ